MAVRLHKVSLRQLAKFRDDHSSPDAPGELRCICAAVECYKQRQTPESITSLALLHCL